MGADLLGMLLGFSLSVPLQKMFFALSQNFLLIAQLIGLVGQQGPAEA
jgi:hypothetical protein